MPATVKNTPRALATFEATTADAGRRWHDWSAALAEGRELAVEPREIVEVAAYLGYREPIPRLQADAAIIREVRDLEEQAARWRKSVEDAHAAEGGIDAIRRRVVELRAEATRLEKLDGFQPAFMTAGQLAGKASRLRAKHPQLFPDARENRPKKNRRNDA